MSNFLTRTISGFVFLLVMVFGIIWDRLVFACLFLFILWMALKEFYAMALGDNFKFQQKMGLAAGATLFLASAMLNLWTSADVKWLRICLCVFAALVLLLPVSCIFKMNHEDHGNLAYLYAGLLYVALPVSLAPFIVMDGEIYDGWLLLSFFILIWISDIGAYCLGTAFGQKPKSRKLAPEISPKKSWWGFFGAVLLGVAAAVGLHYLTWLPFSLVHCLVVGVIISVGAVCGDLVESMWKRYFHVKDSGNVIPGHGGILDRFDSSIVAIPLACVYLTLFGLL